MKFFRSFRLPLAGLAAIAVLSGCGDNGNPTSPFSQLDTTPPPAPENLSMTGSDNGRATLVWTESAAPDVAGYQVYVLSGGDYVLADDAVYVDNSFTLPVVPSDVEASYRVRAVDTSGNRSAFSTAADIVIPAAAGGGDFEPIHDM